MRKIIGITLFIVSLVTASFAEEVPERCGTGSNNRHNQCEFKDFGDSCDTVPGQGYIQECRKLPRQTVKRDGWECECAIIEPKPIDTTLPTS